MDDEKTRRLDAFLAANNLSSETITKNQYRILGLVDDAIQRQKAVMERAGKEMKEAEISISSIAKEIHVSNKTFYNTGFLGKYVTENAEKGNPKRDTSEAFKRLKAQYDELKGQVGKLLARDADIEEAKLEIEKLQNELSHAQEAYNSLQERYEQLLQTNSEKVDRSKLN